MNNIFNSLGNFLFWVFAIFIAILAGVVWYAFEYWYIFFGIPVLLYIIFFIANFKRMNNEVNQLIKEVEERDRLKKLNKN
ncbi:hypothetical protein [Capnocytophaga canimorsus]|uniref:hypothetical protein n=1 Tax=Capnocytophaga canimorsus TaxID=28188 RepID=UPI000F4F7F20|nr:hypothetical protein [Capnocytophaga canimorsus]AYW36531.1 hypothetical protein D8L92_03915 [Capnocytophaga canimorsus]MDT9499119.1 hypothetical protein [Capnocytophaga canimorsus]